MLAEQQKMILYAIFAFHTQQKQEILHQIWLFFEKNHENVWWNKKNIVPLHSQKAKGFF